MKLEDVAKRAQVSIATVSRVLNNSNTVKNTTKARVLRAIRDLKYHPNIHARNLAGGRSRTFGMIVSNLENPFFLDIFRALESEAHRNEYEVVVSNTDYEAKQLLNSVHLMISRRVAGLAVIVSEMEPTLMQELSDANLPVVLYDVGVPTHNISSIKVNYQRGIQRTVEYLYSLGHRRMTFVGHHTSLSPLLDRKTSFVEAVKHYGRDVQFTTVADRDGPNGGEQAMRTVLASGFNPTAIICVNDFMALGVLKALRERGLRVPGDISVTGYDNISLSEFACPALTTVNIPREKIGHLAFEALIRHQEGKSVSGLEFIIETELVIRDSTGLPPQI